MRALVREAMLQGAMGVSTALEYTPAPYASTEELIALAAEAAKFGGIYASHMRDEGDNEPAALDEAIRIGREAHIPVEIFHLKVAGKSNFGKMPALVAKIEAARASGVDITADTYAYPAWFNGLSAFIPPWAHDGGDARLIERLRDPATRARIRKDMETPGGHWDNEWQEITGPKDILIGAVQNPELLALQGKTLADLAVLWKEDPLNALFDLIIKDDAFTDVAVFAVSEPDITLALQQPWVSICNDSSGTSPDGLLARGTSSSPRLRHFSAHFAQVRAGRGKAFPAGCHSQVQRFGRAAHGLGGSRRAEGRHVGRYRGVRTRSGARRGDLRESKPALAGNALCIGERRSGDRRWKGYRRPSGQSTARSWISDAATRGAVSNGLAAP